ncbi:MAG: flagellar motor protein MotB [Desulfurivibrionaceae bacterium]
MEDKGIIIKKVKKVQGGGHHGGSWKVAFADFMTGMMAFFLLMWLVNMTTKPQKEKLAHYFQEYSLFSEGGSGGKTEMISPDVKVPETAISITNTPAASDSEGSAAGLEQFKEQLQKDIEQHLADVKDQVHIEVVQGGIKVDIMDKEGNPMFPLGSTTMTASGQRILKVLCDDIKNTSNRIEIEGHTDAVSYATKGFGNWELSTARASAARFEVEKDGIPPSRLLRVSGYAATEPIIKDNPYDPRNRRISLRLYPEKKSGPAAQPQPNQQAPAQPAPKPMPQNAPLPLVQPTQMK